VRSEGTKRLTMEVTMLLDLIISRCRASVHADEEVKELVRGALEATKQEIAYLEELVEESERGSGRKAESQTAKDRRAEGRGPGEGTRMIAVAEEVKRDCAERTGFTLCTPVAPLQDREPPIGPITTPLRSRQRGAAYPHATLSVPSSRSWSRPEGKDFYVC